MPVTDDQAAILRAQLTVDREAFDRSFARLTSKADRVGYAALLMAAFTVATERRFPPPVTRADFIRFVADVRGRTPSAAEDIDPLVAERLLLAALTDESIADLDGKAIGAAETLLLGAMVADEDLDPAGREQFIEDARALADEWMS